MDDSIDGRRDAKERPTSLAFYQCLSQPFAFIQQRSSKVGPMSAAGPACGITPTYATVLRSGSIA